MRSFTTEFIQLKNRQETGRQGAWAQLLEVSIPNSTVYITSHPETLSYAGNTYRPVPLAITDESQTAEGQLPSMVVNVWNYGGEVYRVAKDNDLSLRDVTIRLINTLSSSGDEAKIKMQIRGISFSDEVASFELGWAFDLDAEGPTRTWNRRDHPGIPFNFRSFGVI